MSVTSGGVKLVDCARARLTYPKTSCNKAKCMSTMADSKNVAGDLDCSLGATPGQGPTDCPDDLSKGAIWTTSNDATRNDKATKSTCVKLSDIKGELTFLSKKAAGGPYSSMSVATKVTMRHPHLASKRVSVVIMKRRRCWDKVDSAGKRYEECHVYKAAHCIKCPGDVVENTGFCSSKCKDRMRSFASCCIAGQSTWTPWGRSQAKGCGALRVQGGVFDAATGGLKGAHKCTGNDMIYAQRAIRVY